MSKPKVNSCIPSSLIEQNLASSLWTSNEQWLHESPATAHCADTHLLMQLTGWILTVGSQSHHTHSPAVEKQGDKNVRKHSLGQDKDFASSRMRQGFGIIYLVNPPYIIKFIVSCHLWCWDLVQKTKVVVRTRIISCYRCILKLPCVHTARNSLKVKDYLMYRLHARTPHEPWWQPWDGHRGKRCHHPLQVCKQGLTTCPWTES